MARAVWYVVADLINPSPQPFAVMRVDVAVKRDGGVEGTVISLHSFREEAQTVVNQLNKECLQ